MFLKNDFDDFFRRLRTYFRSLRYRRKKSTKKEAVLYDGLSPRRKHPAAFCPIVHCFLLLARSAFLLFHSVKAFFCSSVSSASMDFIHCKKPLRYMPLTDRRRGGIHPGIYRDSKVPDGKERTDSLQLHERQCLPGTANCADAPDHVHRKRAEIWSVFGTR